ncbi:MAG: hypothetical protein IJ566_04335 [Cardiobacteriaceae bacterium]|nr:hypothetical protein [Cardiobacteriaceae bacterium]
MENIQEAILEPERVVAKAMCYDDVDEFPLLWKIKEDMLLAIKNAQAGWFDIRSWNYWHLMLDLKTIDEPLPDLPKRKFDIK